MRREIVILLFTLLIVAGSVMAEDYISLNEKGNQAFKEQNYKEALEYYRQAEVERPETPELAYNHANALVESGNFEEATQKYNRALNTEDIGLQSDIYYNTGNSYFKQEDYVKAIESYQRALELNPDDLDAKFNLELARVRLQEQLERQPQDNQNQDQQQDQKQQQQQQQQQEQPQPQQGQQEQEQQQEQDEEQQQQKEQQPKPKPDEMTPEDARRILRALEEAEKENQENRQRFKAKGVYIGNDW